MKHSTQTGSALLAIIVISAIATTIFTAASSSLLGQLIQSNTSTNSSKSYLLAESGIEDAVLNLLRNPDYTGGTLTLDSNDITIEVTGTNPKTITATVVFNNTKRTLEITALYSENNLQITSWREI